MTDAQGPPPMPANKGMSTGAKVGLGVGIGCLALVIIFGIGGFVGYKWVKGKYDEFVAEFEAKGFKKVAGQALVITEPPTEPTYYLGQTVNIETDADVELGVLAQMAELSGTHTEKVYFRGQIIKIKKDGHLMGGLDVQCQVIQNFGTIEGEVTGAYQMREGE